MLRHDKSYKHVGVSVKLLHAATLHLESGDVISDVSSRLLWTRHGCVRDEFGRKDLA